MLLRMLCAGMPRRMSASGWNGAVILAVLALMSASGCRPDAAPAGKTGHGASSASVEAASEWTTDPTSESTASDDTAVAPPANPQDPDSERLSPQDTLALADDVAALGDSPALAFAALLRDSVLRPPSEEDSGKPSAIDAEVMRWRDEAERRAGSDITTLVMLLYLERGDTPARRALVARWRSLEPQNLVPLLYDDAPGVDLLDAAAAMSASDAHYDDVLRAFIDILSRAASPIMSRLQATRSAEERKLALAMSFWSSVAIPPIQRIATPCRDASMPEQRRGHCRDIARVMWHRGDLLLFDVVGASIARRLSESAEEKAAAEAFRREYEWLTARMADAYGQDSRRYAKRFLHWLSAAPHVTERGMMRQLVVEAGFPPAPPADWGRQTS